MLCTLIFYVFPYQEVMCLHSLVVEGVVFNVAYHEEKKDRVSYYPKCIESREIGFRPFRA